MKKYRITLLLKDGTEFEKINFFESYEASGYEAKRAFGKSWAVMSYEVEDHMMSKCVRCSKEVDWRSVKYLLCGECYQEVILKQIEKVDE